MVIIVFYMCSIIRVFLITPALEQYRAAGFIGPAQIFLLTGQISALLLLHRAEMRAGFVAPLAVRMTVLLAWKHGKTRSFQWIR